MRILKNWVSEGGVGRSAVPFAGGPAIVLAGDSIVDFFPSRLSHVVDEHAPSPGLKSKREWVAKAQCPDRTIHTGCRCVEWIVRRDAAIGVESKNFTQQSGQRLRVGTDRVFACRNIKFAIGSEMQRSAIMVGRTEIVQVQQHHFTPRNHHISVRGEAAHPVVDRRKGRRVVEVDVVVAQEPRIECYSQ